MASEDETLSGSDGEIDSETEDDAMEKEFGHWLQQLEAVSKTDSGDTKPPAPRISITPKQVMDSFRNSVLLTKEGDTDLDAILGDLCALEAQLSSTQSQIDTLQRGHQPSNQSNTLPSNGGLPSNSTSLSHLNMNGSGNPPAASNGNGGWNSNENASWDWDDVIESQLQALDSLADLSTNDNEGHTDHSSVTAHSQPMVAYQTPTKTRTNENAAISTNQDASHYSDTNMTAHPASYQQNNNPSALYVSPAGGNTRQSIAKPENRRQAARSNPGPIKIANSPNAASSANQHSSSPDMRRFSGGYQSFNQDLSPNSLDTDSAFSDSVSLPSSGSHISVATSGSGGSNNQMSSGFCSAGDPQQGPVSPSHKAVFTRLQSLKDEMVEDSLDIEEQAAKLKAEKIKIALEKIKQANVKKLFVRAHTSDGGVKSLLVDETMTVEHVIDKLLAKNHVQPSLNWAVVEHLPDLHMERLLEDHALLVECMMAWENVSPNSIHFIERVDKYDVFLRPEEYLIPEKREGESYSETKRTQLIRDHFSESNVVCPELDGPLYIKAHGKKSWRKYPCMLRSSGLYYNPKGKSKSAKDLVCLQKFHMGDVDMADVYTSVGWKKKFKAPNEFGFALKHPKVQKKCKYITYLCAETCRDMARWVTAIRIAKHGAQLRQNYEVMCQNIATFSSRDVTPNPHFAEYVAAHEQVRENASQRGTKITHATTSRKSRRGSEHSRKSPAKSSPAKNAGGAQNKSDINVVILDRRQSSVTDHSNPNIVVLTKRDSVTSDTRSQHSLDSLSQRSEHSASSLVSGGGGGGVSQLPEARSEPLLDAMPVNPSTQSPARKGSLQLNSQYQQKQLQHSSTAPYQLHNTPVNQDDSSENLRTVALKTIPSLPVNTLITKQLTEQTGIAGTLNRQTLRRMKKSVSSHERRDSTDLENLPPPPPMEAEVGGFTSGLSSPGLPPPPSQEEIGAAIHQEIMDEEFKHAPKKAPLKLEQMFDTSGYMTLKSASKGHSSEDHYMQVVDQSEVAGSNLDDSHIGSYNTGTVKRAKPPPPTAQKPANPHATDNIYQHHHLTGTIKRVAPPQVPITPKRNEHTGHTSPYSTTGSSTIKHVVSPQIPTNEHIQGSLAGSDHSGTNMMKREPSIEHYQAIHPVSGSHPTGTIKRGPPPPIPINEHSQPTHSVSSPHSTGTIKRAPPPAIPTNEHFDSSQHSMGTIKRVTPPSIPHNEHLDSSLHSTGTIKRVPPPSIPHNEHLDSSLHSTGTIKRVPPPSIPHNEHLDSSLHSTGTIKRAPPPPPPKRTGCSTSHYAVSPVPGRAKHGYDTPRSPVPCGNNMQGFPEPVLQQGYHSASHPGSQLASHTPQHPPSHPASNQASHTPSHSHQAQHPPSHQHPHPHQASHQPQHPPSHSHSTPHQASHPQHQHPHSHQHQHPPPHLHQHPPSHPHSYSQQFPAQCYGTNIKGFVSDLSRVVQGKHTRMGRHQITDTQVGGSNRMAPPTPPPPRGVGDVVEFVPEDLPPPPAILLEELKILRAHHRTKPAPPTRAH